MTLDVKGFDITGVVTEVDLTFPQINDACDCIQACLSAPTTCASWVWKFSTPASVASGHRTCTLCKHSLLGSTWEEAGDTNLYHHDRLSIQPPGQRYACI
jgi:hypothetical protein